MLTRAHISHLRKLGDAKYRQETGLFVAEGLKTVHELLSSSIETLAVYYTKAHQPQGWLSEFGNRLVPVSERDMALMSQLKTPPGLLAECRIPVYPSDEISLENELTLILDGISDPGNLGTIVRTAEWFGVSTIFCSADSADPWQPKVVQSAMGSLFRARITRCDLQLILKQIKERNGLIYGAMMEGRSIFEAPLKTEGSALVIGSESHGIRPAVQRWIDLAINIPRAGGSLTESLNAAVATAIIISEFKRSKQNQARYV